MANCAHITRRSIFKLAPAAVLATGGAVIAFPAKSEPLTLDQEIDQTVERLEALLAEKYPAAIPDKKLFDKTITTTIEGGYLVMLMANPPKIAWSGEGYYEIFADYMNREPTLMWVEQCWPDLDGTPAYRAYVRKSGKQIGCSYRFTERSLRIYKKI